MRWQIFISEAKKVSSQKFLWIVLAVLSSLVALIFFAEYAEITIPYNHQETRRMERITWPASLVNSLQFANGHGLGGWIAIILAGNFGAQEYRWRTFHLSISRGISRRTLLLSKYMALLLPLLLIVVSVAISGGLVTAWFTRQLNPQGLLGQATTLIPVVKSALRTFFSILPYAALSFYLAVQFRSAMIAITGGLAYTLILEGVFAQLLNTSGGSLADMAAYLPAGLAAKLIEQNHATMQVSASFVEATLRNATITPETAAIGILAYTFVLICASLWVFQRQDLYEQTAT